MTRLDEVVNILLRLKLMGRDFEVAEGVLSSFQRVTQGLVWKSYLALFGGCHKVKGFSAHS